MTIIPSDTTAIQSARPSTDQPQVNQCVAQLCDLERWFGTRGLAAALDQLQTDPGFQARTRAVRSDGIAEAVERARDLGAGDLADLLERRAAQLPVAEPYLGVLAQRTAGGAQ
ncbi:MAG: hypothetical protein JOZ47_14030 [Kutzneria sp.]|nr:hypothetical protein [Kutzneria sp.]MBV9846170.1 hypothetical protein [Kutzneria sp.]